MKFSIVMDTTNPLQAGQWTAGLLRLPPVLAVRFDNAAEPPPSGDHPFPDYPACPCASNSLARVTQQAFLQLSRGSPWNTQGFGGVCG